MNNPLVSVIVPVYNVEKYLCLCINSILSQTYSNIEIILVNDGSTDNCGKICDDYATRDSRVIAIHKTNGGLSEARNTGLEICRGDYIAFIDSDDLVHSQFIEVLYRDMNDSDLIISSFVEFQNEDIIDLATTKDDTISNKNIYNQDEFVNEIAFRNQTRFITACTKLYEKKIFKTLRFPPKINHEDDYIQLDVILNCRKIVVTDHKLYFYRKGVTSITSEFREKNFLDKQCGLKRRESFFLDYNMPRHAKYVYNQSKLVFLSKSISHDNIFFKNFSVRDIIMDKRLFLKTKVLLVLKKLKLD